MSGSGPDDGGSIPLGSTHKMTDEEIVKLVIDGQKDKYSLILDRYGDKLFRYLKRLVNWDEMTLEDLTQETLIKVYINLRGFDQKRQFSSWIYRIAHNVGVDFLKKQRQKYTPLEEWEEVLGDKQELVEELAIKEEEKSNLKKALKELDLKSREILVLFYMEEKSYEEISDILEIPVASVGVGLMRAKQKLGVLLRKQGYEK